MKKFLPFALLAVVLVFPFSVSAATYYVSPTGSNSNNGTSTSTPWQTISKINSTTFAAGDSILFQGGQTFSTAVGLQLYSDDTGTPSNPIVIDAYGTGRPTINSTGSSAYCFDIYNTAGISIQNIICTGAGSTTNTVDGISLYNDLTGNTKLDTIIIRNVDVSGYGLSGLDAGGETGQSGFKNVTVASSTFFNNAYNGIVFYGAGNYSNQNVLIDHVKAYNNSGVASSTSNSGSGIIIGNTSSSTVQYSEAYNNGALNSYSSGPVGIWTYESTNVTIQFNESHDNRTNYVSGGGDGGGFDFDGGVTNSLMQYNYSHDNFGAGYLFYQYSGASAWSNNTARFNISQNDGRQNSPYYAGISIGTAGTSIDGLNFHNNTIFNNVSGTNNVSFLTAATASSTIANNIFYAASGSRFIHTNGLTPSSVIFRGNDYYTSGTPSFIWAGNTYTTYSSWQGATNQEKISGTNVGTTSNPLLSNPGGGTTLGGYFPASLTAYTLQSTSPMIDAGRNLLSLFSINPGSYDYYGNPVLSGSAYDIGAHEYDNSAPSVSLTAPTNGATVSGASVSLTATASDNVSVAGVRFKLDTNTAIGSEDTSSPYAVTWDTSAVSNGSHTLIAVARDTNGNYATSTAVNVTVSNDTTPPVLSAGSPSGEQVANTTSVTLSLSTNESALCKYGTTANTAYASIANSFSATSTTHSTTISGLSNGQSYSYYIRCQDAAGNANTSDYTISFSVANVTPTPSPAPAPTPAPMGGGGGGGSPAPQPQVPVGGFTATASTTALGNTLLHLGFGSDITTVVIATSTSFAFATYINATSTLQLPTSALPQTLYIKYCNQYGRCSDPTGVQIGSSVSSVPTQVLAPTFPRDLSLHMTGEDVLQLQQYLNAKGFTLAASGVGSPGKETNYFGLLTYQSLVRFQEAYAADILTPGGLTKGTGYFGPATRTFVNSGL